jgi:hypothetical protein
MRSLTKFSIASAVMLALAVPSAQATHWTLTSFTGHTDLVSGGLWSGTNNFSVWDISDLGSSNMSAIAAVFVGGSGSAAFPGTAVGGGYLYLYQPTNDGGTGGDDAGASSVALAQFTNSIGSAAIPAPTVFGHISGWALGDGGGQVSAANDLDNGALTGAAIPGGLTDPSSVTLNLATRSIIASYSALAPGGSSSIIAFISSAPPGWFTGSLQNGGGAVSGRSPAPVPAPAAALLGVVGLGLVGVARKFRLG